MFEFGKGLVFRLVPSREQQIPRERKYIPDMFMHIPFLMLMGYLSRKQNTHLLRKLLLPVVIVLALHTFRYYETNPDLIPVSWIRGKSIQYPFNLVDSPFLTFLKRYDVLQRHNCLYGSRFLPPRQVEGRRKVSTSHWKSCVYPGQWRR